MFRQLPVTLKREYLRKFFKCNKVFMLPFNIHICQVYVQLSAISSNASQ